VQYQLERNNRDQVDEKPALKVVLSNFPPISDDFTILIEYGRVEDGEYVNEEEQIDDVVGDSPGQVIIVHESHLKCRHRARIKRHSGNKDVPIHFVVVLWLDNPVFAARIEAVSLHAVWLFSLILGGHFLLPSVKLLCAFLDQILRNFILSFDLLQ
jgi:hypothetical protein